jgi:hypothetical protein
MYYFARRDIALFSLTWRLVSCIIYARSTDIKSDAGVVFLGCARSASSPVYICVLWIVLAVLIDRYVQRLEVEALHRGSIFSLSLLWKGARETRRTGTWVFEVAIVSSDEDSIERLQRFTWNCGN